MYMDCDSPHRAPVEYSALFRSSTTDSASSENHKQIRHASSHSYESPRRHQRRNHTAPRQVKETLDAHSEYSTSQDDGVAQHKINQYIIKQEIGRGSFGAVHLAVDQFGQEYAVKEFSKARLRKRQQSHVFRRPRVPRRPGTGFNSPLHRHPSGTDEQDGHPLDLIKEEIAIMKKLNHNNLVSLFEVLDDPTEDSLYMVMEMCNKGVIMRVGLGDRADPYDDENCRCWFRDLILGIEYLHAQGIVHRDIKPDNCLLTSDDVLKVVDFGVSEMFAKDSDMYTAKSVGSPAFLPPELCVVRHGDVSGKAADIWSMGVTLYCLRYGRIPFEKQSIFELYESIKNDDILLEGEADEDFKDLIAKILNKDPTKRITMHELRNHPWVTKRGSDPLLSEEENTAEILELPTEEEMNWAITSRMGNLLVVMKAVSKFKRLLKSPQLHSILGHDHESHFVQPPLEMEPEESLTSFSKAPHSEICDKRLRGGKPIAGRSLQHVVSSEKGRSPDKRGWTSAAPERDTGGRPAAPSRENTTSSHHSVLEGIRGHARSVLEEEHLYLFVGPSTCRGPPTDNPSEDPSQQGGLALPDLDQPDTSVNGVPEFPGIVAPLDPTVAPVVSESPGASEIDIYETAYREEVERIKGRSMAQPDAKTKVYLTRRVEGKKHHLGEVLRLILQAPDGPSMHSESEPVLQIGGRVPGTVAHAGAATSTLTAQLESRRRREKQAGILTQTDLGNAHTTPLLSVAAVSAESTKSPNNSNTASPSVIA